MELEQEFIARALMHKVAILKGYLATSYIAKEKCKGGIILADQFLERDAMEYADSTVGKIMFAGKLDEYYNEAWEKLKGSMPDNFSIMGLGVNPL